MLFFDVFGNYSLKRISKILNKNGRYVTTIPKMGIFKEEFLNFFRRKKSKLIIVKSRSEDLKWLCDKIEKGKIKPVVDKIFPLVDIRMAQKYIESKRAKEMKDLPLYTIISLLYGPIVSLTKLHIDSNQ
ncbi:MAG: zinc-binding dehydrogenase, partial [Bdellovibrionales bacterium]|nr:zinc-binding dehydrogenase [Bdellovibrionales bacterium]